MEHLSETQLIATFTKDIGAAGTRARGLIAGAGDDAAILRGPGDEDYVVTSDTLVEGRHFELEWFSAYELGWRLAAVNMSDVAAMGGTPRFALLSFVIPGTVPVRYVQGIERGAIAHLRRFGAVVVGGNVTTTDGVLVCEMTLIGSCRRGRAWRRRARAGDAIVVAGALGEAAAGLAHMQDGKRGGRLVNAYKKPTPKLDVAAALRGYSAVNGAIDVSDGLSTDIIHVCRASDVGCEIDATALPATRALKSFCIVRRENLADWILDGGEDYALILSVAPGRAAAVRARIERSGTPAAIIGRFTRESGVYRLVQDGGRARDIEPTGWDHLRDI